MKLKYVFLGVLVLMAFVYSGSTTETVDREQTYKLDIVTPIKTINGKFLKFLLKFQLLDLVKLVLDLWNLCLKGILNPEAKAIGIDLDILESKLPNLNMSDPKVMIMMGKLKRVNLEPILDLFSVQIGPEADEKFCNAQAFIDIHKFIWVDDHQVEDFMKFLYKANYPQIYDKVYALYDIFAMLGCDKLSATDLPKRPLGRSKRSNPLYDSTNLPNVRQQYLNHIHKVKADDEPPTCLEALPEILKLLQSSGLLELLDFVETLIIQVNTDASLHFCVGKLAEPIKGKSVRKFRLLPPVRAFMKQIHQALINDDLISGIFDGIKGLLQIDFYLINPVDLIISIVEFLIWGTPFLPPEL